MKNEMKGFSLFNDLEDKALRIRNRAVVMCNIAEQNTKREKINEKGVFLILSYFQAIPDQEKYESERAFATQMKERGFNVS